jgi:maltose O-acetyltransferase
MQRLALLGSTARRVLINQFICSAFVPHRLRGRLLRLLGMRVKGAYVAAGSWFGGVDIEMGPGSGCNIGCVFDNLGPIRLGRNVYVGHQVLFLTSHHDITGGDGKVAGKERGLGITVGDGSWIGARATIMPGVTIGERCIVGAGAVVTRDCAPGGVYAGVPARRIKEIEPTAERAQPVGSDPGGQPPSTLRTAS